VSTSKLKVECYCLQTAVSLFQFSFNLGSGEMVLEYNATRIDDGLWHRIRVTRFVQFIQMCSPGHQMPEFKSLYLAG
jgi:hypothetical protein